ncbi:catalase family peroxidase [Variovorax sp. GT1P44]|uniref:catalase family peroxidase n=1 Tax=Variovorax sp. GT1P44 TaxID=3443742 RepID=UPI003F48C8C3
MRDQVNYSENKLCLRAAQLGAGTAVAIAGLMAVATPTEAGAAPESVVPNQSPGDLVDALHAAFGVHHARAVHAKGVILKGTFSPDANARSLSKATIFASGPLPMTVRFSDFTGIPDIPDTIPEANPRGFAVKVKAKDGEEFDVVTHSFNGFPTSTSDEFAALLRSIGASGGDAPPHPTAVERFLADHPVAKTFLTTQKPPPVSYATAAYYGVNSLKFTNGDGKSVFVRYRFVPRDGEHYLTTEALKAKGPGYLRDELSQRLAKGAIAFDWFAQIASDGDRIEDPSIAWPDERKLVKLGTLSVVTLADDAATDKQTLFLPGVPHAGIEAADPMLTLRTSAYPLSFRGRQ